MDNELLQRAQTLYSQAQMLEEQLQMVREQIVQLTAFNEELHVFNTNPEKKVLASLGKGVYLTTELANKELWVDVGAQVLVKKNVPETQRIITDQIERLHTMREPLEEELGELGGKLTELSNQIQGKSI